MALASYTDLKTTIASFLNREDLTSMIPDFISLAEARFKRDLRLNSMMKREFLSTASDTVDLPDDWLESVSVVVVDNSNVRAALEYVSPDYYNDLRNSKTTTPPRFYTIIDTSLLVLPVPSSNVNLEVFYYGAIPALSSSVSTNWLLQRAPDLYLYASLIQAEAYLQNDERIQLWAAGAEKTIADIKAESERAKRPQGSLSARKRTFG